MSDPDKKELSPREVEVLALVARGFSNGDIATALRVSQETVKTHIEHILVKLKAHNRAHAVAVWLASGTSAGVGDVLGKRARPYRVGDYSRDQAT